MGYRRLLKRYIRHLELVAGDNFIEQQGVDAVLEKRDLGELRRLAADGDGFPWERSPDRESS